MIFSPGRCIIDSDRGAEAPGGKRDRNGEDKRMKKKYAAAALMLAAAAGLTACSAGGASNDYIRIAKYKGVEVEAVEGPSRHHG